MAPGTVQASALAEAYLQAAACDPAPTSAATVDMHEPLAPPPPAPPAPPAQPTPPAPPAPPADEGPQEFTAQQLVQRLVTMFGSVEAAFHKPREEYLMFAEWTLFLRQVVHAALNDALCSSIWRELLLPENGCTTVGDLIAALQSHNQATVCRENVCDSKPPAITTEGSSLPSSTTASSTDLRAQQVPVQADHPLHSEALPAQEEPAQVIQRVASAGSEFSAFEESMVAPQQEDHTLLADPELHQSLQALPVTETPKAADQTYSSFNDTYSSLHEVAETQMLVAPLPAEPMPPPALDASAMFEEASAEASIGPLRQEDMSGFAAAAGPPELHKTAASDTFSAFEESPKAQASPTMVKESLQEAASPVAEPSQWQASPSAASDTFSAFEESVRADAKSADAQGLAAAQEKDEQSYAGSDFSQGTNDPNEKAESVKSAD